MLPIKPEPFENSPERKSPSIKLLPDIKSESIECLPDVKSEWIEYTPDIKSESIEYVPDVKSESIEYTPEIHPTKRLKTLSSASLSPSSKGKSIIEKEEDDDDDDDDDSEQQLDTCGVCLLEEGMSLRGFIDSCEHYFCFVCIMEWAKVESRCPICKRRFYAIRRPPKDGVFLSERFVNVPVRDQIYCNNGNATLGPSDPYSQVKCSICRLSSDDNLLLLCDLCDSAAHSYCVGLGATVPEGDWFCKDCSLSRDEHAKIETDHTCDDNNKNTFPSTSNIVHFTRSDVSIQDIVRESSIHVPVRSSVSHSLNQRESISERSTQPTVDRSNNARTLKRCLNVHARIQVLRENWDGFRGGSLNFSSSQGKSNQESTVSSDRGSYNIDKAWKMMDIAAKALGRKSGNKTSVNKHPKPPTPIKKERLLNDANKLKPNNRFQIASTHVKNCYNYQNLSRKSCLGATSNVVYSSDRSSHLIRSPSIATDKCCAKKEIETAFKKESIKKNPQFNRNIKEVENAKSEIQSLVKLNLKLLNKHKKLETDVFKEVARHATHSIMSACDIEPPKARFRSFKRVACDHSQTQNRPKSTLMPTSCRECFFVFVKNVVTAIACDRTGSSKV